MEKNTIYNKTNVNLVNYFIFYILAINIVLSLNIKQDNYYIKLYKII